MPDVGFHVFVVRECRDWPNVLGLQAIAGRVPGQFFEDHQTESPDAALCLRRCGWLGLAKAFWNSGSACMNLMRATFARAACGMSSRFASPRLILRSKDFRAESWPGLKYLWCSWFLATSSRARQPQQQTGCASDSASNAALARLFSQAFRIASLRSVAGRFSFSDCSVVILPLKTAKIFGHKITWGSLWSRLLLRPLDTPSGGAFAGPFPLSTSRRRAFTAEHFKRTFTPPGRTGSRRLRAPLPSGEALSVFAERASPGLRAGCPGEWRWRCNPPRPPSATPTKLGPALSSPGGG